MAKSDKLRRNVNMLNPVPILFSVVVIRHEYCTQLSVQNIVLRQLKVQRIYSYILDSGVCRWWPISREGNNKTVEFSSHGSYQVKSGKIGGIQDCRLTNLLLVRETNIFQWPFFYGWFQDFQENATIVDILFEVDVSESWLFGMFGADDYSHILCTLWWL